MSNIHNNILYIIKRTILSISGKAKSDRQTEKIYRIDAHWLEESSQKIDTYLEEESRKSRFPKQISDGHLEL